MLLQPEVTAFCHCRVKPRKVIRKVPQSKVDSPVDPTKRKGESPSAGARPMKKLKATPPEFGLSEEEPEAHDAAPERHEDAPASSEEGEDAEIAAQKEKAAREERAVTKERRSKAKEDAAPKETTKDAPVAAGASSTPRVDATTQDLVLTQSPIAEVVNTKLKKAPVAPSGLGHYPLASAGFPELYRQLGAAYEVRFHSPKYA